MLLTVLIVFASATIAALVVQVTVGAAGSQQRRAAAAGAEEAAAELADRTVALLGSDPTRMYIEVLDGESARVCDLDLANNPEPIPAGQTWPTSCGSQWSYEPTTATGMRIHPPDTENNTLRIEAFVEIGGERVGKRVTMLLGGKERPDLYFGDDVDLEDFQPMITGETVIYAAGELTAGDFAPAEGSVLAAEKGFTDEPAGATLLTEAGMPGAANAQSIRTRYPVAMGAGALAAAASAAQGIACPGSDPVNSAETVTSLCLAEGLDVIDAADQTVTIPSRTEKPYLLLLPSANGQWTAHYAASAPANWPGQLSDWGVATATFKYPATGLIYSDRTTVIGLCQETLGACTTRSADGLPGYTADVDVTIVVGGPTNPAPAILGAPVRTGNGTLGVISDTLVIPAGATPAAETLELEGAFALTGTGAGNIITDAAGDATGSRPSLQLRGVLLLARPDTGLDAFTNKTFTATLTPERTPPWLPGPTLGYRVTRVEALTQTELDTLLA